MKCLTLFGQCNDCVLKIVVINRKELCFTRFSEQVTKVVTRRVIAEIFFDCYGMLKVMDNSILVLNITKKLLLRSSNRKLCDQHNFLRQNFLHAVCGYLVSFNAVLYFISIFKIIFYFIYRTMLMVLIFIFSNFHFLYNYTLLVVFRNTKL